MKSIANQYRDLKEGKMTQANFMRNLRMSMPQFVTNTTSFKDAVRILKNKSILTEISYNPGLEPPGREDQSGMEYSDDFHSAVERDLEHYEKYNPEYKGIESFFRNLDPEMYMNAETPDEAIDIILNLFDSQMREYYDGPSEPMGNEDLGDYYEMVGEELESLAKSEYNLDDAEIEQMFESEWHSGKNDNFIDKCYKDGDEPSGVAASILEDYMQMEDNIASQIDRMEDEESGKYTKFQDFPGGISEGKKKKEPKKELHPNQIHPSELRMGIRVEMEHTGDPKKAEKIALDHLAENPFYYTALKLSGIESPSAPKAKPVAPKKIKKKDATEMVDQANQMQKVKLMKEALEKLIREELSKKKLSEKEDNAIPLKVSAKNIEKMKEWLKDQGYKDMEDIDIDELSDNEVLKAIRRDYDGGVKAFIKD